MPSRSDIQFAKLAVEKGYLKREDAREALKLLRSAEGNKAQMSLDRVLVMDEKLTKEQVAEIQDVQKRKIVFCACGQKTNIHGFKPGDRLLCASCGAAIEVPEECRPKHASRGRTSPGG
jgi:hypothetical protein